MEKLKFVNKQELLTGYIRKTNSSATIYEYVCGVRLNIKQAA